MTLSRLIRAAFALAVATAALAGPAAFAQPSPPAGAPTYEDDVAPLLRGHCLRCHGGEQVEAGLDLGDLEGVWKGSESGPVIVPGEAGESLLFQKVRDGEMPPEGEGPLDDSQVDLLRRWIARGADAEIVRRQSPPPNQHDVIPILLRHCTACHGRHRTEAGLDLRSKAAMLAGGKSGPALVPGKPDESLLIGKVREGLMPPPERLVEASVKPIEPSDVDVLIRWIACGAPESDIAPDVATTAADPLVSDADRDFWAFRPPQAPRIPQVQDAARVANPIDAFVVGALEARGLTLAPQADRTTLIRRASFDLTGLPPDPADVQAFLADRRPEAWPAMVEKLLASPRYGERWGRYWLDLAGYADSEGKREQDLPRPHAWRYRDYVIRSFNDDKPYDRFLLEQLAGDELADYESAPAIDQQLYDNLVATGFLRMAPDATWANITGYVADRIEVVADEVDVLGSAVMGLTLKCARCHDHKIDPIPQRDYYRLVDVFKGALDEYDWLKPDVRPGLGPVSEDEKGGRSLPFVTTDERRAWEMHETGITREIDELREAQKLIDPGDRQALDRSEEQIKALEASRLAEPRVHALWDRGEPSPTYVYRRGDYQNKGPLVGPGVPSVLTDGKTPFDVKPPWPGAKQTGRRLAFARWLTRPAHPLTARVAVNRIWKHHFGTGLVKSLDNFGKAGSPPTHPELLDWLACEFVRQGWSIKAVHRLVLNSSTWRQTSVAADEPSRLDPDNAFYSRMPLARLDAESLYDSLLAVAGRLDPTPFGPGDPVDVQGDGLAAPRSAAGGWRRLIFVRQARKQLATHLETFDFPQMNPNCIERRDSTVAPQALYLANNRVVYQLAADFACRVRAKAGPEPAEQVRCASWMAFGRPPTGEEQEIGVTALNELTGEWRAHLAGSAETGDTLAKSKALADYCHALFNSAAFLYVD